MVFISFTISIEIHNTNTFHYINYKTITMVIQALHLIGFFKDLELKLLTKLKLFVFGFLSEKNFFI